MIKILLVAIAVLLCCQPCIGDNEPIESLEEDSLPILNEELRSLTIENQIKDRGELDAVSRKVTNVATCTAGTDAVNKTYADTADATKAAKGANSDITSLTGLTTPLSEAQGGTGSTTLSGAYIAKIVQLSYTGNGNDDRNLTGAGFNPNYAIVVKTDGNASNPSIKSFSMDGVDRVVDTGTGAATANRIQDFITDGVQLGSDNGANQDTHTYDILLILTATGAASG